MKKQTTLLISLLGGWLLLNWVQSALLGLDPDEAYYWTYSQQLAWGYFDHPPAIALLIFIGRSLAGGELGLRLLMPVLSAGTFLLLWDLAGRPKQKTDLILLALLFAAMPLLQVYAFVATPDVPLLFFSALFFWTYQKFLGRPDWLRALALGAVMAALLYSKYHGVLLIFFTLLSNWRLLLNPRFYAAGVFGALLFLPHLYWQYAHDFPSFRYHLSGRDDPYELKHSLNYLLNQLLIFSPLLFPLIIRTLWRRKPQDELERAFRFIIFGFWAFFFYTTFKGHVEPQWTVILSLAFIVLLYRESIGDAWLRRWVRMMAASSVALLMLARVVMAWPDIPLKTPFNRNGWIEPLQAATAGSPVVFQNSYRNPSLYRFYTGEEAYTFTDNCYRRSQYDIWNWEKGLQDRSVWMIGQTTWENPEAKVLSLPAQTFKVKKVDRVQITQKVQLEAEDLPPAPWRAGDSIAFRIRLSNPYAHDIHPAAGHLPISIKERFGYFDCLEDRSTMRLIDPPAVWPAEQSIVLRAVVRVPEDLPPGEYAFFLCLQTGDLPLAYAGPGVEVWVGE